MSRVLAELTALLQQGRQQQQAWWGRGGEGGVFNIAIRNHTLSVNLPFYKKLGTDFNLIATLYHFLPTSAYNHKMYKIGRAEIHHRFKYKYVILKSLRVYTTCKSKERVKRSTPF